MALQKDTLPITVDKSHLITIGEKLYSQSIELIRELVNNAYDADAAVVEVNIRGKGDKGGKKGAEGCPASGTAGPFA